MEPRHKKKMIRDVSALIVDYLVFELLKNVTVNGSVNSGSAYIYFDKIKIRISDHNRKGAHNYFIDIREFQSTKQCLNYFINTVIKDK